MTVLLQVSDPHFGTERPEVVNALLRFAAEQAPDIVVLSGDITQRARRRQFERARAFVDSLPSCELIAIPGNHDIPLFNVAARLLRPYGNYMRCFGDELAPALDLPGALVIGVNTTRWYRHKHGEISPAQVARIAGQLRRARPEQARVVVVHQPVVAIDPGDEVNVLRGARRAVREWSTAGADVILGGHIHLPYVCSLRQSYPELERAVTAVQAGTAVSKRTRNGIPNSVNVLRCSREAQARQCAVERWDFCSEGQRFELVTTQMSMFAAA